MKNFGHDLAAATPRSLTDIPDIEYDFVATMGCGDECPFVRAKRREDWQIPDPRDMPDRDFDDVRDLIERKVKDALAKLDDQALRPHCPDDSRTNRA